MNNKYFFISKPRCASTFIFEGLTNWNDKKNGSKPFYHLTASEMKKRKPQYNKSFSFAVIRNPYDLVCSWYYEHRKDKYEVSTKNIYSVSLDDWINSGCPTHWKHLDFNPLHQYKWVYDKDNRLLVSYLFKIENFNDGIENVYKKVKPFLNNDITLDTIKLNRKNESLEEKNLNSNQKEKIYNIFKKDFIMFNYEK